MSKQEILSLIQSEKIIAVIRGKDANEALEISRASIDGGVFIIELTYTTPYIEEVFHKLKDSSGIVGAGTVLDTETARHAILLGAKFIVSPSFNEGVAKLCNKYNIPYFPGCMTIKEITQAMEFGCDIIKLFPANHFSTDIIKSIKGPLPAIQIMPTGGVNIGNLNEWLHAGAIAVGIGSDLNNAFANGGYESVRKISRNFCRKILEGAN